MQRMKRSGERLAAAGLMAGLFLAAGATGATAQSAEATRSADATQSAEAAPAVAWLGVELTDVRTEETFTLAQFAEKPLLLETFAVWCGVCTYQQQQIDALHDEVGDSVVSVALNTDPNESQTQISRHLDRHGFDWRYAVSPVELSRSLRDEFGVSVLHPPSAPVILICPGQTERTLLRLGAKRPAFLQERIAACPATDGGA